MTYSSYINMALGQILVQTGLVSEAQLETVLSAQKPGAGKTGTRLVAVGALDLLALEMSLARQFGVPPVYDNELENLDSYCRSCFPVEMLEKYEILPFRKHQGELWVAMTNPRNHAAIETLQEIVRYRIRVFSISEIRFQYYLFRHFQRETQSCIRNLFFEYLKGKCRRKLGEGVSLQEREAGFNILRKELFGRNHSHEAKTMQYLDPAMLGPLPVVDPFAAQEEQEYYYPKLDPDKNPFAQDAMKLRESADFQPEFADWTEVKK